MITPQQRNAWRGAYLRELRKIAQNPIIPDFDSDESVVFSWDLFDESIFEDHLVTFYMKIMVPLCSTIIHVLKNHPLTVASIDERCIRPQDSITRDSLFHYLQAISRYGQDVFFTNYPAGSGLEELLLKAIKNNDVNAFLDILDKNSIDSSDMCLKVGYVSRVFQAFQTIYSAIESNNLDEAESIAENEISLYTNRGVERSFFDFISDATDEETQRVIILSQTSIRQLDEDSQKHYALVVKQWIYYLNIANLYFRNREVSIIKELIEDVKYQDIVLDIERLAYRMYDFTAERLYRIDLKQE